MFFAKDWCSEHVFAAHKLQHLAGRLYFSLTQKYFTNIYKRSKVAIQHKAGGDLPQMITQAQDLAWQRTVLLTVVSYASRDVFEILSRMTCSLDSYLTPRSEDAAWYPQQDFKIPGGFRNVLIHTPIHHLSKTVGVKSFAAMSIMLITFDISLQMD